MINEVQLNFYLPNYMPNRRVEFTVKVMLGNEGDEQEVGQVVIDTGKVVTGFKQEQSNFSIQHVDISDAYSFEYELYVDKTKYNLDKLVASMKGDSEPNSARKEIHSRNNFSHSGSKGVARSVDSEDVTQERSSVKGKDLAILIQPENVSAVYQESSAYKPRQKELSETSSQKRVPYTSARK